MPPILTGIITRETRSNPWPRGSPVYRYPNRGFTPIGGPWKIAPNALEVILVAKKCVNCLVILIIINKKISVLI